MAPIATLRFGAQDEDILSIPHILNLKRNGGQLNAKQITFLVKAICDWSMEDAQLGLTNVVFLGSVNSFFFILFSFHLSSEPDRGSLYLMHLF